MGYSMRASEVKVGMMYAAKVSGKVVPIRVIGHNDGGGWPAVNLRTGRLVRIRGAGRLRFAVMRMPDGSFRRADLKPPRRVVASTPVSVRRSVA